MYCYGVGSNQVHKDCDAIGAIYDRRTRDDRRRLWVELSHGGRQFSDILTMSTIRTMATCLLFDIDRTRLKEIAKEHQAIRDSVNAIQKRWSKIEYPTAT